MKRKILFYLFIPIYLFPQTKEERVLNELVAFKNIITQAAGSMNLAPRVVASVIYAERYLNYNWEDDLLDELFAESGYNSSIGFGQIKPTTAFFVEQELYNSQSKYYLGGKSQTIIQRSKSKKNIIEKLMNDTTNIYYCAAFLAMIKQRWSKTIHFRYENETGIVATLYSLGVIRFDGTERKPHTNPQINIFGKTAQEFFDSFKLRQAFN